MKLLDVALLGVGIACMLAFLVIGVFFGGRLSAGQLFWTAESGPLGVALVMTWLARNLRRAQPVDLVLVAAGAVLLLPWLIIGIFFLHRLSSWQLLWGGNLGAIGTILFVTGLVRTIQRRRA